MNVFETELELLQNTADTRFGGDVEALGQALDKLESEATGRLSHFYRKVGNNCLVWSYNSQALKVCEQNPDKIQGVLIDEYGFIIQPGATVIGSYISGPGEIVRDSRVINSNVSALYGYIARSTIVGSRVSLGPISGSEIHGSYAVGRLTNVRLIGSMVSVGSLGFVEFEKMIIGNNPERDRPDTDGTVADLLAKYGLRRATDHFPILLNDNSAA